MSEAEHGPDTLREGVADLDTSRAHPARVYDYWLGGTDNFPADREAAERVLAAAPGLRWRVRANRAFLGRAGRYLAADAGVRQFLDIGTGIPAAGNTHEVARQAPPDSRVVYVDNDPFHTVADSAGDAGVGSSAETCDSPRALAGARGLPSVPLRLLRPVRAQRAAGSIRDLPRSRRLGSG